MENVIHTVHRIVFDQYIDGDKALQKNAKTKQLRRNLCTLTKDYYRQDPQLGIPGLSIGGGFFLSPFFNNSSYIYRRYIIYTLNESQKQALHAEGIYTKQYWYMTS